MFIHPPISAPHPTPTLRFGLQTMSEDNMAGLQNMVICDDPDAFQTWLAQQPANLSLRETNQVDENAFPSILQQVVLGNAPKILQSLLDRGQIQWQDLQNEDIQACLQDLFKQILELVQPYKHLAKIFDSGNALPDACTPSKLATGMLWSGPPKQV